MLFAVSDAVQLALISAVVAVVASMPATLGALYLFLKQVKELRTDVHKIEVATNSMKDALVKATADEAVLRGGVAERARADAEAKEAKAEAKAEAHSIGSVAGQVQGVSGQVEDLAVETADSKEAIIGVIKDAAFEKGAAAERNKNKQK